MKKMMMKMFAIALSLSLFVTAAGCKRNRKNPESRYTGSYELATPTGTRVLSDEPDLPEEIVYWEPERNLKPEYTLKEATEKYAFIVNHTTLIYTSCPELRLNHSFRCVDYGSRLFTNSNQVLCLDPNGWRIDGLAAFIDLDTLDCSSSRQLIEKLPYHFVGPMGRYSEESSDFDINVLEEAEDHVLVHIRDAKEDPSHESLYYGRPMGGTWVLARCNIWNTQTIYLTEADISDFTHYVGILFDHLSPDDGTEAYIYDKAVNIPLPRGMHITGFNALDAISSSYISFTTREGSDYYRIDLLTDAEGPDQYANPYYSDWQDMGDMLSRVDEIGAQQLYFTIDGVSYLCTLNRQSRKPTDFDSAEDLLDVFRESCLVK